MSTEIATEAEALMRRGRDLHQQGRLREASGLYQEALTQELQHFGAWHLLGVIAFQSNQPKLALDMFRQAWLIDPASPEAHNQQGNALLALEELAPAIGSYDRTIENYDRVLTRLTTPLFDTPRSGRGDDVDLRWNRETS